jgi:hypothetical protein
MAETVLLDTHNTRRRLLQNGLPLVGAALVLAGIAVMVAPTRARIQGGIGIVLGLGLIASAPRVLLRWDIDYKGHAIRFENHILFGERLLIDGVRVARGGLGIRRTLRGVIPSGDGKGEQIRAESEAGLTIFKVRIVAQGNHSGDHFPSARGG